MALVTKNLIAHNLHKYSIELEKAILEGWRVHPTSHARRSLGNKFMVTLAKGTPDEVENTAPVDTTDEVVQAETDVEQKVEQEAPVKAVVKTKAKPKPKPVTPKEESTTTEAE